MTCMAIDWILSGLFQAILFERRTQHPSLCSTYLKMSYVNGLLKTPFNASLVVMMRMPVVMSILDWNNWTFRLLRLDWTFKKIIVSYISSYRKIKEKKINLHVYFLKSLMKNSQYVNTYDLPTCKDDKRLSLPCFLFYSNLCFIWHRNSHAVHYKTKQNKTNAPVVRTNI